MLKIIIHSDNQLAVCLAETAVNGILLSSVLRQSNPSDPGVRLADFLQLPESAVPASVIDKKNIPQKRRALENGNEALKKRIDMARSII
ncbi:hypothetical protein HNR50_001428 [Spirochaeta isovalerica]|uniref:Uncharacterized protein n=1 Tax=Spirochaeta isovalerica TaxID=150 RepID=A0A841R9T7_9SPIO|nr:hypothetical protein [Spirochaeta isovalerica]